MRSRRVRGRRDRGGDRRGVLRIDEKPLTQRRHRGRADALGEALIVEKSDVKYPQSARAARGIQVLAAILDAQNLRLLTWMEELIADVFARMLVGDLQATAALLVEMPPVHWWRLHPPPCP